MCLAQRSTMSITVEVGLLSGRTASVKVDLDEKVAALKLRAAGLWSTIL